MLCQMEMETWWKRVRLPVLAVLGLLQYWYFWKCEVLVLILFLKISGIGISIDILFEYGQYWYWYWYPFWKLSVLVFVLILTLKICRIDIDIDIIVLSYGMKYQYLLKRAGIAHLWSRWCGDINCSVTLRTTGQLLENYFLSACFHHFSGERSASKLIQLDIISFVQNRFSPEPTAVVDVCNRCSSLINVLNFHGWPKSDVVSWLSYCTDPCLQNM